MSNDFCPPGEPSEGWRVELPSGEVAPVAVVVKENYQRDSRGDARPMRMFDTVTATVTVPAPSATGGSCEMRGVDSCVRWALAKLAGEFASKGWRVSVLAPGEPSRAEAVQRARELLAISERFREAWRRAWDHVLNDPFLNSGDPGATEAYHRIAGRTVCGHGGLESAARKELGPLWSGWQDRAEYAFEALGKVCAAAGVKFTDTDSAANALVASIASLRAAAEKSERERLLDLAAHNDEGRKWAAREEALIDAAFADLAAGKAEPLRAALVHALGYCHEPADQTVMCPECNAAWWGVPEDIDENWHAPGCKLFAARVLVDLAVDVTHPREPREAGEHDWKPDGPRPDDRSPAEKLRDVILDGWFRRLARLGFADVPKGVPEHLWMRAVHAVIDRLPRPATGPYALGGPASPASSPEVVPRDSEGRPL